MSKKGQAYAPSMRPEAAATKNRFWQQFRSARGIATGASELLALLLGVLEFRAFLFASLGHTSVWLVQASTAAMACALLGGAIAAMRWGNLLWLLLAWAFVLGVEFPSLLQFTNNLLASLDQMNAMLAVLSANFEVPVVVTGFAIAVLVALSGPRKRPKPGN